MEFAVKYECFIGGKKAAMQTNGKVGVKHLEEAYLTNSLQKVQSFLQVILKDLIVFAETCA